MLSGLCYASSGGLESVSWGQSSEYLLSAVAASDLQVAILALAIG